MKQDDDLYPFFKKLIQKHRKPFLIGKGDKKFGNSLSIGNPGYAKTSGNRREIELRYNLNHKIFCLYDGGTRMDMAYFMFKSISNFWKIPKLERGNKIVSPRSYPTELLYPVSNNLPDRLPNPSRPFTIGVSDINEEDLVAILGSGKATDSAKIIFKYLRKRVNENTTPEDFLNYLGLAYKDIDDTDKIKLSHFGVKKLKEFFTSLMSEGLLSSKKAETSIDIRSLIRDRKTISVLILRHIPESYWGFLVHFFLKHISNTLVGIGDKKGRRLNIPVTLTMNEIPDLLDEDDEKGSAGNAISKMISKIAKQSRTFDIFMLLDTQLPQQLPDIKETMKRIYVYNSSRAAVEKAMEIIGVSTRTGEITSDDLLIIPRLSPGWYYLFDRDEGVGLYKQVWTRSRTYEDGEDFYQIYDKIYGKASYYNVKDILIKIRQESESAEKLWKKRFKKIEGELEDEEMDYEEYSKLKGTY